MSIIDPKNERDKLRAAALQERSRALEERKLVPRLNREFNRYGADAARQYRKAGQQGAETALQKHVNNLNGILRSAYARSIGKTTRAMMKEAPKGAFARECKDVQGAIDRLLQEWITSNALLRATTISETSRDEVLKVIEQGVAEGLGERAVAKAIRDKMRELAPFRARTIARTETHTASQSASLTIAEEAVPDRLKEWVPVGDERTRGTHAAMSGKKVKMRDRFKVGDSSLLHPGDPAGEAKEVINCRCVLVYVRN